MRYETYTLDRPDHVTMTVHRWTPDEPPKARIILAHGYGEHAGRYQHVADYLTGRGYAIDAPDYHGHGKTALGHFGYFDRFDLLIDDLKVCVDRVVSEENKKPLFLLGHSAGGLLALMYLLRYPTPLQGLVLFAPYVNTSAHVPAMQRIVVRALSNIAPRTGVIPRVDSAILSHDPAVTTGYDADPLVHHGAVSARVAVELLDAGDYVRANAGRITLPTLVLHGKDDQLAQPEFGQTVYDRLGSTDKTIKLYEGYYHEILNEPGKQQVLTDTGKWLDVHL